MEELRNDHYNTTDMNDERKSLPTKTHSINSQINNNLNMKTNCKRRPGRPNNAWNDR
jgi:hypothetical protein